VVLTPDDPLQSLSVPLAPQPRQKTPVATKPTAIQPPSADAKPVAETGSVVFDSRPSGATVQLDGRVVGRTPLNIGDVRAGNHAVRFELDGGYRTWSASVDIKGGFFGLIGVALIFGLVNALIGPILRLLSLPLTVITFGLFSLIVNGVLLAITAGIADNLDVGGFFSVVLAALVISLLTTILAVLVPDTSG